MRVTLTTSHLLLGKIYEPGQHEVPNNVGEMLQASEVRFHTKAAPTSVGVLVKAIGSTPPAPAASTTDLSVAADQREREQLIRDRKAAQERVVAERAAADKAAAEAEENAKAEAAAAASAAAKAKKEADAKAKAEADEKAKAEDGGKGKAGK